MVQTNTPTCRKCGTPLISGQRFCSNCGAMIEEGTSTPTTRYSEDHSPIADMSTVRPDSIAPPPPPPDSLPYSHYPPMQTYPQDVQPPMVQVPQQATPPPNYAVPQTTSAAPVLRRIGCGLGIFLILLLSLCGVAGYFTYNGIRNATTNALRSTQTAGANDGSTTGSGSATTPTAGAATTTAINATITYASISVTILDVRQAVSFADDTSSSQQAGVLRLDIKEQNATSYRPDYFYSEILRLLLPNQQSLSPLSAQTDLSPDASITRTNWIDFAVPTTTNVTQTTLQFGSDKEAQMVVPLTGKADLSQYQEKTATLGQATQYGSLKWTIKTAVHRWSNEGKQAAQGMRYIVLNMSIDNPSSTDYSAVWQDDLRLKSGGVTSSPSSTNIPVTFSAASTGTQATAAFLVPQNATSYTFIILPETSYPEAHQATIDFQV